MESNHEDFISTSFKYIVVKRIDEGTIRRALDEILRDPALLSYYGKD